MKIRFKNTGDKASKVRRTWGAEQRIAHVRGTVTQSSTDAFGIVDHREHSSSDPSTTFLLMSQSQKGSQYSTGKHSFDSSGS